MTVPNPTTDRDVSRRQLLASTGSLVALGSGVAWVASESRPAAAADVSELDVPNVSREGKDGSVTNVTCQISGAYQYASPEAETLRFALSVSSGPDAEDWAVIDETTHEAGGASGQGQYSLAGSLLAHPALDAATFSADPEETKTVELPIKVVFDVLAGGEAAVSALATTVATVEVTNTTVEAEALISGSGQIGVEL